MSILFDALSRAAQDYQQNQTPGFVPVASFRAPARRRTVVFALALLLAASCGGASGLFWMGEAFAAKGPAEPAPQTSTDKPGAQPSLRSRHVVDEPDGIVLEGAVSSEEKALSKEKASSKEKDEALSSDKELSKQAVGRKVKKEIPARAKHVVAKKEKKAAAKLSAKKSPARARKAPVEAREETVPSAGREQDQQAASFAPLLASAHEAFEAEHYARAIAFYDKILAQDSNNKAALDGKVSALEQADEEGTCARLKKLAAAHPDLASAKASLARLAQDGGKGEDAVALWREAVRLEPANASYALGLAIAQDQLGTDNGQALDLYKKVPQPWPPEVQNRVEMIERALND